MQCKCVLIPRACLVSFFELAHFERVWVLVVGFVITEVSNIT